MLNAAVIGSGGAGRNILASLMNSGIPLYLINSSKDLRFNSIFSSKSEIIASISSDPSIKRPLMETERAAESVMRSYEIIFSVSGFGGFYGTAVPVMLTRLSKNVVPIFTLPFSVEGKKRYENSIKGMEEILERNRWAIGLENDMLLKIAPNATFGGAFRAMNMLISEIILGLVRSFDDSRKILNALEGRAGAGIGYGEGMNMQEKALSDALSSPWLNLHKRAIVVIKGGREDDFIWINEKIEEYGTEITVSAHIPGRKGIEVLIIS